MLPEEKRITGTMGTGSVKESGVPARIVSRSGSASRNKAKD